VRLMSLEYVRPYVKAQKNDDRDAEAIAQASTRPTMRFVALKTEAHLDVQVLHRVRDRPVGQRTSLVNQMRSILLERGMVVAPGRRKPLDALETLLSWSDNGAVGRRVRLLLNDMLYQWHALDTRIAALDDEFADMARNDPAARRLATIPGIGVLNATALVAAIGDGWTFSRSRDLSAWLGRVPHQAPRAASQSCSGSPSAAANICVSSLSKVPGPLCLRWHGQRRRWAPGSGVCSREPMATPSLSRWQASWPGSPGRCFATKPRSPPANWRQHRTRSAGDDHPTSRAVEGL